ncbi:thiamine-phosphate kinase [Candidatus Micrarchaeota archaeon]|nr:thiamine-phosphate kinase [Candidatus Micrarchaeota archaeon]
MRAFKMGEKKFIQYITAGLFSNNNVLVKPGADDAACVKVGNETVVLTTDIMFLSTHFPVQMTFEQIGRKITIANLSDLAAMGSLPISFLAAFGLPSTYEFRDFKRIISGINSTCREYNIPFVGGDTKKAKELTISGIAVGTMQNADILKRSNSREGDIIAVTGNIGSAACGMLGLLKNEKVPRKILNAFLHPTARIREGRIVAESKIKAAGMDITDGLLYSVSEISSASNVRIDIELDKIPVDTYVRKFARGHGIPIEQILNIGEDYELLLSADSKHFEKLQDKIKNAGGNIHPIGNVRKGKGIYLNKKKINPNGYDAFKTRF